MILTWTNKQQKINSFFERLTVSPTFDDDGTVTDEAGSTGVVLLLARLMTYVGNENKTTFYLRVRQKSH